MRALKRKQALTHAAIVASHELGRGVEGARKVPIRGGEFNGQMKKMEEVKGKDETRLHTLEPNVALYHAYFFSLCQSMLLAKAKGDPTASSMSTSVAYGQPKVA